MKTLLKVVLLVLAFTAASGATYIAVQKRKASEPIKPTKHRQDTIEGVNGLSEGETVTLPTLSTPNGEKVNLANLREEHLLCVFVGSICSGCPRDADLWRELSSEAGKRGVAFYLVNISDQLPDLEQFNSAYNLQSLPLLYDPNQKIGQQLKVGFLPQYVLFTRDGQVVHRWDGIRNYNKNASPEQLAQFFEPHSP
jgi:peroxiredoxin